ncbi:phosphate signaling complex protein PhoU [Anaerosacchariphilus polymeriproducens]|uniref:Phosphate-specific transport system accessory protein PhoU n=1 Tax=Anaerosacchariphilus polymeriproducens TaxID=1812858 RepID=A0A371AWE3_9FIRM|nr:phosphate signaling complex protein PhoU [Anaerosacchariphilus polymeriproducens]RDU23883.1 phosphate transport system regulatory protein PhoU [Anaerosacchariphilus polymeriproducens]
MRNRFDEQLEVLNVELIEMGVLCEEVIAKAAKAFLEHDNEAAKYAISKDLEIDQKEKDIEALCLKLLLQQQPVAKDLRQISSALKMITDMERIGDQASDIAEISTMMRSKSFKKVEPIEKMSTATIKMVTESIDAFVKKDLQLAKDVIDYDDVVDDLFDEVRNELIDFIRQESENAEYYVDLLMIAKYFERLGDHATNIAEWVVFSITGVHKDLDGLHNSSTSDYLTKLLDQRKKE